MNNKSTRKILSLVMAVALALGVLTASPITAQAAMPLQDDTATSQPYDGVNFAALAAPGNGVYYGAYKHATMYYLDDSSLNTYEGTETPILWRVMGEENNDTAITLMSEYVLDGKQFHSTDDPGDNYYNDSDIREWLNDAFLSSFSTGEQGNMATTDVKTGMYSDSSPFTEKTGSYTSVADNHPYANDFPWTAQDDTVFLPWGYGDGMSNNFVHWTAGNDKSEGQISSLANNVGKLKNGTAVHWWLRSPEYWESNYVRHVSNDGDLLREFADSNLGVRPAFKLKTMPFRERHQWP